MKMHKKNVQNNLWEDDEKILMGTAAHNTYICEDLLNRECEHSRGCVLSDVILMGVPCQRVPFVRQ